MSVSIRQAAREDVAFLAWVILNASRGHLPRGWFDISLKRAESLCLEFLRALATADSRSRWHYSRFLVAEIEEQTVAALAAFGALEVERVSIAALMQTLETQGFRADEQDAFWERAAYLSTCIAPCVEDRWIIDTIATLPAYRRHGCTAALFTQALQTGRARGYHEAQVTFYIGNEAAEHSYIKAGFAFLDERQHPRLAAVAGVAGVRRYVRRL
jgi:GNAT superfamily N-acetyltransferase